jgi:hypothetical protein
LNYSCVVPGPSEGAVRRPAAVAEGRSMVEDLCALDKVVGGLVSRCRVRVATSTSTPRGEGLGRVGVIPLCGSFQNLIFLVGRLGQLEHLEPSKEVSPSHLTGELVTPGPNG